MLLDLDAESLGENLFRLTSGIVASRLGGLGLTASSAFLKKIIAPPRGCVPAFARLHGL
jgi:hypothetical protein